MYTKKTDKFGTFYSDEYPKKRKNLFICSAVMFFLFALITIILCIWIFSEYDIDAGGVLYLSFMLLIFVGFGIHFIRLIKKLDYEYNEFLEEVKQLEADKPRRFYEACVEAKINNVTEKANIARLEILAKNHNINASTNELIKIYRTEKAAAESRLKDEELKKVQDELERIQEQENKLYATAKRFRGYTGKEKRIEMLKVAIRKKERELANCEKRSNDIDKGTHAMYVAGKEHESDSFLLGGIASGIAGGAAGLATALDVQSQNAEVRAHNKELLNNTSMLWAYMDLEVSRQKSSIENSIKKLHEEIEKTELKLVEKLDPALLLKHLAPKASVKISKTGAVLITVTTSETKDLKIYDTVPAVVDGTLKVKIMKDDQVVGFTYACLPIYGSTYDCEIETICLSPDEKAENYTVSFEAYNLWAIEK